MAQRRCSKCLQLGRKGRKREGTKRQKEGRDGRIEGQKDRQMMGRWKDRQKSECPGQLCLVVSPSSHLKANLLQRWNKQGQQLPSFPPAFQPSRALKKANAADPRQLFSSLKKKRVCFEFIFFLSFITNSIIIHYL